MEYYRRADVFCFPSVREFGGAVVLEAMACERVVLASDAGGIPEMIEHRASGVLIPRAHLHRLGEAILEVLGLPIASRRAMGAAARQRVEAGRSISPRSGRPPGEPPRRSRPQPRSSFARRSRDGPVPNRQPGQ